MLKFNSRYLCVFSFKLAHRPLYIRHILSLFSLGKRPDFNIYLIRLLMIRYLNILSGTNCTFFVKIHGQIFCFNNPTYLTL